MMSAQVALRQNDELPAGLRPRKKIKTRLAIEDAALALFDEHGYDATTVEQIAELAEVSTTTFFRYFPSKAEVVLSHYPEQLPALRQAIIDRPAGESDLTAVRRALHSSWVEAIDAQRTARKARTIATSPLLRGLSFERGLGWVDTLKDALAQRRGLRRPNEECAIASMAILGVLGAAVDGWIDAGCRGDLAIAIERSFDIMTSLCRDWSKRRRS
jgi:AcrR family transcriptional regulator